MFSRNRLVVLTAVAASVFAFPATATADHATRPHTQNMHALGESPHPATFLGDPDGVRHINSDIAFQGSLAFNGNYDGFRIIDISDSEAPQEIVHQHCNGDQGDIAVWGNILVRSWNSKKAVARTCDGQTVPAGWEGVHVFDISDVTDPALVASVELPCGSHTVTLAPDVANGRLIVYSNNSSSSGCGTTTDLATQNALGDFIDVIEVPINHPENASLIHREPLVGPTDPTVRTGCHDMGVILGTVNLAACASADTTNVFDIGANSPHPAEAWRTPSSFTRSKRQEWTVTRDDGTPPDSPGTARSSSSAGSRVAARPPNASPPTRRSRRVRSSTTRGREPSSASGPCPARRTALSWTA
jgi:hypothetical protein